MAIRFTVGQLAKLTNLTKQALIHYDHELVFCPKYIDPMNGYRYYTADQLEVLDSILILKEIGLSLAEIRSFMEERNEENAIAMLGQQHGRLTEKIKTLTQISKCLEQKMETLEHFHEAGSIPEWVYLSQPQPILVQEVQPPGGLLEVDLAIKKLFCKVQNQRYPHFYQIGTMISTSNIEEGCFLNASYTFLPLNEDLPDNTWQRPVGCYLRSFHKGSYESVGDTYRKMLEILSQSGRKASGFSYEYCILDSLTSKVSCEYVTEIYLPVI